MGIKSPAQYLLVKGLIINVQILIHKLCCSHNNHHFSILFLSISKLRFSKLFLKTNNFFLITCLSPCCQTVISFYVVYFWFQFLMFTIKGKNDKWGLFLGFSSLKWKSQISLEISIIYHSLYQHITESLLVF